MGDERQLRGLIRLIYESSLDPSHWQLFLTEYTKAISADAAGLMVYDAGNLRGNLTGSVGFDPLWEAKYAEHYSSVNLWLQRGGHLLIPGRAFASEEAVPAHDLVKTEFYNDFLKPQGFFSSLGATLIQEESKGSYLTAQRSTNFATA